MISPTKIIECEAQETRDAIYSTLLAANGVLHEMNVVGAHINSRRILLVGEKINSLMKGRFLSGGFFQKYSGSKRITRTRDTAVGH